MPKTPAGSASPPSIAALATALVLAFGIAGVARAEDGEARYRALLTAAQATDRPADKPVDWQALRFAYADRPGYTASDEGDERVHTMAMRQAFASADYAGAIVEAKKVEDIDFVDAEAHLIASQAYQKTGDGLGAEREQTVALGLLTSIKTGAGTSAGTAFTVISVKEEYVLMATYGRRVTRQSLMSIDGHSYDVLETVDHKGSPATYYFQIDRVLAAESHVFRLPGKP